MFDYEYWGHETLSINDNMALEEYLLRRSEENKVATIRFWNVDKDAVVLGYGEAKSAIKKEDASFDVARRITGGSHVQFDRNCFAYSFTVPRDGSFKHYEDMRKYYAEKVADAMRELGIDISKVDNRASTINVEGKVVASHAMFWGVKSALMHGLMIIEDYDVDRILERMVLGERKIGRNVYREYDALKSIPAVGSLLGLKNYAIAKGKRLEYVKRLIGDETLRQITNGSSSKKEPGLKTLEEARALIKLEHLGKPWVEERDPPLTHEFADMVPGEKLDGVLKNGLGYCMYSQVEDGDFKKMAGPAE